MHDDQIIQLYFERNEQAIRETQAKYGAYCLKIADSILGNCQDAEEVVSDTWLRVWNAIPPQRPAVLRIFLGKITRNLAFSTYRRNTAAKRGSGELNVVLEELGACVGTSGDVGERLDAKELAAAIRGFLETQPQRDRAVFLRRYFYVEEPRDIGAEFGLKEANVYQILSRLRKKLKEFLIKEGYDL